MARIKRTPRDEFTMTFRDTNPNDDFADEHAAEHWLAEHGYSVGRGQRGSPRGILFGDFDIQKWRNLRTWERAGLDGQMVGGRGGPVTITIWRHRPVSENRTGEKS